MNLIDYLIDKACGYNPADFIILHCPDCEKTQLTDRQASDGEKLDKLVFPCPDCWPKYSTLPEVIYLDRQGNRLEL